MADPTPDAGLVEAILFLENEPVDEKTIASISGLSRERVDAALAVIRETHADDRHGVELAGIAGGWTLAPKPAHTEVLQGRYGKRNENRLSRAALETLSIVAYSQPVTRAEIEGMRGVSAEGMLHLLVGHGLIKVVGKRDAPGKPLEFGTTREFLRLFRLSSIAELPKLDEVDREKFDTP